MAEREDTRTASEQRLSELVLYIASTCEFDRGFGAVKLNKVLFYSDFGAYLRLGRPITGVTYRRLQHGPVPRALPRVREQLIAEGRAVLKTTPFHGFAVARLIGLVEPDLDLFTSREIALVDEIVRAATSRSASELSERTHEFRGWELAEHGEDIPYSTVFLATGPPLLTAAEKAYGAELAEQLG